MSTGTARVGASSSRRLDALRGRLSEEELDALVVSYPPNLRYLTGFTGSAGLLVVDGERALLLVDSRYGEQARAEAGGGVVARLAAEGPEDALADELAGRGAEAVGFEAHRVSVAAAGRLREKAGGVAWRETEGLVEELRARKEDGEIALLRRAVEVACGALEKVLELLEPGATEAELAAELDHRLRLAGTGPPAFDSIVASGPRSALPHARPSGRRIREGDLVLFDFGATVEGYCSDVTRTVVVGPPRPWQRRVHDAVRAALESAVGAVGPGRPATEVDAAARAALEEKSIEEGVFGHSVGHGIGLEVHEKPSLSRESDDILQTGNVVTIEPGVYLRGRGGVRLEDDVVVGDAPDVVSDLSRDLVEI